MANPGVLNNYISRFQTRDAIYSVYHGNMILFGGIQLAKILTPGLFQELKRQCKYPSMFQDANPPRINYELSEHIIADKLIEELRVTLANALVFIHTWISEHPLDITESLRKKTYDTYPNFFETMFNEILLNETEDEIIDLTNDLKQAVRKIRMYLGPYNGPLNDSIYKTTEILAGILSTLCVHAVLIEGYK